MNKLLLRKGIKMFLPEIAENKQFSNIKLTTGLAHHAYGHDGEFDSHQQATLDCYFKLSDEEKTQLISKLIDSDFYLITDALIRMQFHQIYLKKYPLRAVLLGQYLKYRSELS